MCGLVAILQFDGAKPDMAALRRMSERIRHRGPDGNGVFNEGGVAFAHQRLSIIDLATGQQPMTVEGITATFNGEIYNYIELRDELKRAGHVFRTTSDTEVLLRMYLEYGTGAIARLNGMFAFVLYDSRREQIVAARDHFGIKPLYVCRMRDRLIYASEIKSILAHPEVDASVDPVSLHDYVTLQYTLGDGTLFRGIRKVPAGHFEVTSLSGRDTRQERFWRVSYEQDRTRTEDEFVEELRGLLAAAVRQQMRSDVPVGAYLSGGLDSSTVTALAAGETHQALRTFTGAFREGPEYDESAYARAVAERYGAQMHFVYPTGKQFIDSLPKLAYHMDEPAAGPGLFPQYMVSSLAAQHVKVCLGGQGGDEIFGGYARYAIAYFEQALKDSVHGVSEEGEDAISLASMAPNLAALKQYAPLLKRTLRSGIFQSREQQYFSLVDRSEGTIEAFSGAFRAHYRRDDVFQRFSRVFNEPETGSYFNRMLHYDMQTGLQSLLHVEDRVSMAVSLESRVPLLDPRIVELMAKIPPPIKFKGGEMKYLFKRAIAGLLPDQVLNRTDKMGFPVPLQIWARDTAKDFFCDILLSQRTRERGLFDMDVVEQLIRQESNFSRVLWGLLQLELWHREFLDAGSTRTLGVIHAA
jgi:asparagine synthase (glutamine-hydrolysing)